MSIEAAAEALVSDAPAPEPVKVEVVEEPQLTDDDLMAQIWDKADQENNAPPEDTADAPVEEKSATEEPAAKADDEAKDEAKPESVPPKHLPRGVKEHWNDIPEAAREDFVKAQREMGDRLAEQGRQMQGIAPIRDALVEIVKETPELANMKPEQVISEIQTFRKEVLGPFQQNPVQTILKVAQEQGFADQLAAALQGQAPSQEANTIRQLTQTVQGLQKQLQQVASPEYVQQHVERYTSQTTAAQAVEKFASEAEHWADVEDTMPAAISYVQSRNPGLPMTDILAKAYDLEVQAIGKASPKPAAEAPAPVDPKDTEKALKAKSVNVSSRSSGKPKPLTEDQALEQVWAKHNP